MRHLEAVSRRSSAGLPMCAGVGPAQRGGAAVHGACKLEEATMESTAHETGRGQTGSRTPEGADGLAAAPAAAETGNLGPNAAAILATEHWSLIAARSLIWNEAMSRATVFLTVLSASIIALALMADATGFGSQTTTLALVLLPIVFLLGIATYARQIGRA